MNKRAFKSVGVEESVAGDMWGTNTLERAVQGVRGVYHICPNVNPDETLIGKAAIAAAQAGGARHFEFHSPAPANRSAAQYVPIL